MTSGISKLLVVWKLRCRADEKTAITALCRRSMCDRHHPYRCDRHLRLGRVIGPWLRGLDLLGGSERLVTRNRGASLFSSCNPRPEQILFCGAAMLESCADPAAPHVVTLNQL